jgi:hypothetical protein
VLGRGRFLRRQTPPSNIKRVRACVAGIETTPAIAPAFVAVAFVADIETNPRIGTVSAVASVAAVEIAAAVVAAVVVAAASAAATVSAAAAAAELAESAAAAGRAFVEGASHGKGRLSIAKECKQFR